MSVNYAVIPVAGLGTRMRPASSAIPKEMITLVDRPVIGYVVKEAIDSGIKHIVLVSRIGKECITDYLINHAGLPSDVAISVVYQKEAKGLGDAILAARPIVRDNTFAVLLPDVVVQQSTNLRNMIREYDTMGHQSIMVQNVLPQDVSKYGIIDTELPSKLGGFVRMSAIVEKPALDDAPSTLAVVGRYVFRHEFFNYLENLPPSVGGEIQLTDAIYQMLADYPLYAYIMAYKTFDCGSKMGLYEANLEIGASHPELGSQMWEAIWEKSESLG